MKVRPFLMTRIQEILHQVAYVEQKIHIDYEPIRSGMHRPGFLRIPLFHTLKASHWQKVLECHLKSLGSQTMLDHD